MHAISIVATTLLGASTLVSAVDINFARYSRPECDTTYHIRKDTNLHDPHCKTFSDNEPPFSSFVVSGDDDLEDLTQKDCYATVYDAKDCQGNSEKFGDMGAYLGTCMNTSLQARSVRISCEDKAPVSSPAIISTITATTHAVTRFPVTEHYAGPSKPATTTLMLYPHEEPDWYWCSGPDGMTAKKVKRGEHC